MRQVLKSYVNKINLKNKSYLDFVAYILCLAFITAGILVSLNRYWQYEVFYIDFGQYDQSIWAISRFQPPMLDHWVLGFIPIFADHLTPSVFLLSPLYWLTSDSTIILIAQAIAVGLSGLVLYSIGNIVLKDRFISIAIVSCYYMFVGLQSAVITEFHELTVMTVFFMLTFWAFVKKKKFLYFFFIFIMLGFKEVTFLTGIFLGITMFTIDRRWKKEAIIAIILSILWGVIALKIIIPYFSPGTYLYAEGIPDTISGKLTALFDHPLKRHTLFYSFFSFGFLPIFSPAFWLLIIQDYASRFMPEGMGTRIGLGLHYNAQSAVILSLASIFALRSAQKLRQFSKFLPLVGVILIINAIILYRFILHGPFALAYNPAFYKHTKDFEFLDKIVKMVPPNATVSTHNNLASRFTHQRVWLLKDNYEIHKPEYIVIDNRQGQNPNNFTGTGSLDQILKAVLNDPNYQAIYRTKEQYVFNRK